MRERVGQCGAGQGAERTAGEDRHDRLRVGARRHKRRFRANLYFSGAPAWHELEWVGQELLAGRARLRVVKRIPRCPATQVNPETAERDADPIDTLCDYLIDDKGATRVLVTAISEEDIRTLVASPFALVGSDGNCVAPYGVVGQGMPHPRFYGTFPRILSRYVHEQKVLSLELAVHKMTGATARALKLKDRGLLREGFCADVVIFDPNDFADRATYADPHQFPSGAHTSVIVNGVVVVDNAVHTGATPGVVLRRSADGSVS